MGSVVARKENVLNYVRKQGRTRWVGSAEVAGRLGCSRGAAINHLRHLLEDGLLESKKAFGGTLEFRITADG